MPESIKRVPKVNTKQRSHKTREAVIKDKMAQSAIDRLRDKQQTGGGGEGAADGGSVAKIYLGQVRSKIKSRWKLPSGLTKEDLERSGKVHIRIDGNGNLISATITSSSGHGAIDASLRSAVQRAAPFTRPPLEVAPTISGSGIVFNFKAKEGK
ncbi:MAG: TonB C-terminal domain-containing protein [Deltaproteobacteria bacterium]|nr:TonB C-terminal domain-containing protein [Deltaproteobacteria bacterium]